MNLYSIFRKVFVDEIAKECSFWYEQGRTDEAKYRRYPPYFLFEDPRNEAKHTEAARQPDEDDSSPPGAGNHPTA